MGQQKNEPEKGSVQCDQCGGRGLINYAGSIPLCIDCYKKLAQANFMEQQANHNKRSWAAANLNFIEQQLYAGHGGFLPLKQMQIPQPPSAGINYSYSNIQVSNSAVGAISSGDLYAIDTSIEVITNNGNVDLGNAFKELSEALANSTDIQAATQTEILKLISYLSTEATLSKDKRNTAVISSVLSKLPTLITTANAAWAIWDRVGPILRLHLGG